MVEEFTRHTAPAPEDVSVSTTSSVSLEPDDEFDDDVASIDERMSNYTKSLTSSVVDYPIEYGRRYHAYRPGLYKFPNDEAEINRLDLAHAMMVMATRHRLYCSPLMPEKLHNILDIGTGTGVWAIEMGEIFENATVSYLLKTLLIPMNDTYRVQVTGIDLSNIQPKWIPPNVKFIVDDIESPWIENRKYDFIMCRYMGASIRNWPELMRNIYDHLNPGGWAEFQDVNPTFYSEDGSYTEEHATYKWMKAFMDSCESSGSDPNVGPKLEGWVRDADFTRVTTHRMKAPLGPWVKDPFYKDLGMMNLILTLEGLEALSLKLFSEILGWSEDEIAKVLDTVRQELKSNAFHALFDIHVVYGQKPS